MEIKGSHISPKEVSIPSPTLTLTSRGNSNTAVSPPILKSRFNLTYHKRHGSDAFNGLCKSIDDTINFNIFHEYRLQKA